MFSSQHKNSIDQDSSNQQNEEVKTVDQTTVFFLVRNNSNKYEDIPNTDKLYIKVVKLYKLKGCFYFDSFHYIIRRAV